MQKQVETIKFTPEKCKQIVLARLDVVHKWLEFRKQSQNKLQADYDFVKLHNTSNSHLFEILGKISRGSLRATFINLALSQRVSIKFAQDNVGHSKSETT